MNVEDVYKNLDKKATINFTNKKPKDVCGRLDKMYKMGMGYAKNKTWDQAYLMFRRWTNCVEWLKKKSVEEDAQNCYAANKQDEVKRLLREVEINIESDWLKKQGQWQIKSKPNSVKSNGSQIYDDLDSLLPDAPVEEPQPKNKNEITCKELYDIMHNDETRERGVLIIDVRSAEDFAAGKMAFQDYMINIPGTDILPNQSANYYQSKLIHNDAASKLFLKRIDNDIIVLVDWDLAPLNMDTPIAIFKKFLQKQDKITSYKRIAILKGGFDEWMRKYPDLVVRPAVIRPTVKNEQQNEIKKQIENNFGFDYPPSPKPNANTPSPVLAMRPPGVKDLSFSAPAPQVNSNNTINSTPFSNDLSMYSNIPQIPPYTSTPNQIKNHTLNSYNTSLTYSRMSDQPMLPFNAQNRHTIPNSINPSVLLNDISKYTDVPSSNPASAASPATSEGFYLPLNTIPRMKDPKVVIEKLPGPSPAKPIVDRSNKPVPGRKLSIDNAQIAEIESDLQNIRSVIATFEMKQSDLIDPWAKEEYDLAKKKEEELCKKLEKLKGQGPSAPKNGKLYPDLPNNLSGLTLSNKPGSTRAGKPDAKNENKENIQQPQVKIVRIDMNPSVPLMQRQVTPPPALMDLDSVEQPTADTYCEPLRSEPMTPSNSGLKRSLSSPSLQKVKKHKAQHQILQNKQEERKIVPQIDRSSKPQVQESNQVRVSALSSKAREERMEPVYSHGFHPGITGLKNLGNSCYMNSIIQCLSNTVHLANYFNDNQYTIDLNKKNDRNASGYVAEEVAQVIKALWRGLYKSISPRDLKVVVGQYKLQFESYDQQDSHEFLMFLLDWMHNDLKKKSKVSYARELTVAEKEWEKTLEGQSSIISNLFYGQLRSTIGCTTCMQTSTTYETFNSLTMSLPTTNKCTLDDCVKKFVSGQRVSEWKCPNCKAPRDGMKKFDLAKLPQFIIIHLNRFGDSGGWLEKKNTAVDFPLTGFDLKPYVVADADNNSPSSVYNLYAMSNHYGTMDGGHYTAYCKSSAQRKWYKYDDHTVTEVPQSQVKGQSTSAYLLFYASVPAEKMIINS